MNATQRATAEQNKGLAYYWAKRYYALCPEVELEELEAAGLFGLCRAAAHWRLGGQPFVAYATRGIRAAITDAITDVCGRGIRLPRRTLEQVRKCNGCGYTQAEMEAALGRALPKRRWEDLVRARISRLPYRALSANLTRDKKHEIQR